MAPTVSAAKPAPKPDWLKVRAPGGENYARIKSLLRQLKLHTVCEEAQCPNVAECWGGGTATVMLMGDTCTRGCRFCHVKTGNPNGSLDPDEPQNVATAISELGLTYVVLTSVNRDDLPDQGADHFGRTVESIKRLSPETLVEILIPDFRAVDSCIARVVEAQPDVIAHNVETVERLTQKVRDGRASYRQSLEVLKRVKSSNASLHTKSSVMVGLGETREEVLHTMDDLRDVGVSIVTFGQYLRPTAWHLPVEEYIHPSVFKEYEQAGLQRGFLLVPSGPLVRSSYKAGEKFLEGILRKKGQRNVHGIG